MKVRVSFPLSSDGPLGRAAAVAARHASYRVEGVNGMARAAVDLDLPADWRILDDFSGLLRGERGAEYSADETALSGDRKSTRLNSSHANISYAVFCLKK